MKKLLVSFLVLSLVVLGFVSCNSNAITLEDGVGTVTFSQSALTKALSETIEYTGKSDLYWRYAAVKNDKGGTQGQTTSISSPTADDLRTSSLPVNGSNKGFDNQPEHTFSVGSWNFYLYAYDSCDVVTNTNVYYGSITANVSTGSNTVTVSAGAIGADSNKSGSIKIENITLPTSDFGTGAVIKYMLTGDETWTPLGSDGTYTRTDVATSSTTVYVGAFNVSGDMTPIVKTSKIVSVYRGLTTHVSGLIDDQTGGVIFDGNVPSNETTVSTAANEAVASGSGATYVSPAESITANVAPVVSSSNNTTVSIPAGAIDNNASEGDTFQSNLTVKSYDATVSSSTFVVTSDTNVAVAGIDCKMTVSINGAAATEVTDFNSDITIVTYILKGLTTAPVIRYNGTQTTGQHFAYVSYDSDSGRLEFTTNHFSTFFVEVNAEAYVKETNTAYSSVANAVTNATAGQTVVVLRDADVGVINIPTGVTLDGNGKTLIGTNDDPNKRGTDSSQLGFSGLVIGSNDVTVKNVTLTKMGNYAAIKSTGSNTVINAVTIDHFTRMGIDVDSNNTNASASISNCYIDVNEMISNTGNGINVQYGAAVNIEGTTVVNAVEQVSAWSSSGICFWDDSTGVINGCTIRNCQYAFGAENYGAGSQLTVTISDTTIDNCKYGFDSGTEFNTNNFAITLNAGNDFSVVDAVGDFWAHSNKTHALYATVLINGGTYKANDGQNVLFEFKDNHDEWCSCLSGSITVNGGTLYGPIVRAYQNGTEISDLPLNITCTVTGGTFSADPSDYTDLDYAVIKNSNDSSKYDVVTLSSIGSNAKTIVGGLFTNNPAASADDVKTALNYAVIKSGDRFKVVSSSGITTKIIIGGCFKDDPSDCVADGYVATQSGGVWVVSLAPVVKNPVGGTIFYNNPSNGGTYKFYDNNQTELTDVDSSITTKYDSSANPNSVVGNPNVKYYSVSAAPSADRFYVYYGTLSDAREWGYESYAVYDKVGDGHTPVFADGGGDVYSVPTALTDDQSRVNNAPGLTAIGTGKLNTNECLRKDANNSYVHPLIFDGGYDNTTRISAESQGKSIWTWLRDTINGQNVGDCNDWFIPSTYELDELRKSGLESNWFTTKDIWTSVEAGTSKTYCWRKGTKVWPTYPYNCYRGKSAYDDNGNYQLSYLAYAVAIRSF